MNIVTIALRPTVARHHGPLPRQRARLGKRRRHRCSGSPATWWWPTPISEALAIARRAYPRWRDSFRWLFARHGAEPRMTALYPPTFDELMAVDNGVAGSPRTVRDFVAAEIEATGTNYLLSWFAFGDMTLAESLRSLELFSREVMPAFAGFARRRDGSSRRQRALGHPPAGGAFHRHHGASLELRSVSEVLTLRTCGAAVSSATKAWKVFRSGATHLRMKSISPDSIQHSRTSGWARTKSSNALRSASAWLVRCTMANTVTS